MDRLVAMKVFRKVVELGSFSAAADHMGMSKASASKYLNSLENYLGTQLLMRTTRRMSLTDPGRAYYEKCSRILEEIDDADAGAGQQYAAPRGLLKVRAPMSLGAAHLGKVVSAFIARYPEVTIEMTLNDRFTDPVEEGFDVALRIAADLPDSSLVARPLARMKRVLCAAPAYLLRYGEPAVPADLRHHNCIIYTRGGSPDEWHFEGPGGKRVVRVNGNYRCNNSIVLREALLEGSGIGLLPAFIVASDIAEARLKPLIASYMAEPRMLYAVFQNRRHPLPKVGMFVDFLERNLVSDSRLWQDG
jgi:DNA-binding transcriptional LysR family regulator